jgi:ceramidase
MSTPRSRISVLVLISLFAIAASFFTPRIPQPLSYHSFADQRGFLGLHNALNVLSNLPFLLVGFLGLNSLRAKSARNSEITFIAPQEQWSYIIFFLGVFLTGFGSAWYHDAPSNSTLLWDRLPMTLAFLSLLSATISERINVTAGVRFLFPLISFGIASVFYWQWTELQGRGDLRPYLFAQFFPLLIIPLMLLLFSSRYTRSFDLLPVFANYVLAKVFEFFDKPIYAFSGFVSGHTLKHLAAAFATYLIYRMLRTRSPISHANATSSA